MKKVQKAIEPPEKAKTHREIFIKLAKAMGTQLKTPTETEIKKIMKTKKAAVSMMPYKKQEGYDVNPADMIEALNFTVMNSSRLLWLKETEKAVPAA